MFATLTDLELDQLHDTVYGWYRAPRALSRFVMSRPAIDYETHAAMMDLTDDIDELIRAIWEEKNTRHERRCAKALVSVNSREWWEE